MLNFVLQAKSKLLTELVTDPGLMKQRFPLVDVAGLKFRERDDMEETFAFWRQPVPYLTRLQQCITSYVCNSVCNIRFIPIHHLVSCEPTPCTTWYRVTWHLAPPGIV
jgi:hypothetical protein